ncbi:MAG: putative dipeptidase [Acidobacteriaceae bacterium]|nr:putative dipeptidase [Acidobacteriaceae bacterium]
MLKSRFALTAISLLAALSYAQTPQSAANKTSKPNKPMSAKAIHDSALVIDTHADTPQRLLDEDFDMANVPQGDPGHLDFAKAKAGNLGAEFFSIWVDPEKYKGQYARRTLELIDSVYRQAEKHPDKMMMAFSTTDIRAAHNKKKLAALMGVEGGHSIENSMPLLRDYYRLGARYMTLTWSNTNEWADSSGDVNDKSVEHHDGLTQFGREVIREMNRLGMMVDISHVSDRTFFQTLTISRAPVIASHSSSRALTNVPRNMTDDMLRAVKENNGVVMVNFFSGFIDENFSKANNATKTERQQQQKELDEKYKDADTKTRALAQQKLDLEVAAKLPRPPLKALIDHIDHIAKVAGIDHVGLGSDFDGISFMLPQEIDSAADLPKITAELVKRGYSANDIHKILGGNLMRVFHDVEKMRDQIAAEGTQAPLLPRKKLAATPK